MKQELPTADYKATSSPLPSPARARFSRAKETLKADSSANGASPGAKALPKSASPDSVWTNAALARRPIQFNRIRAAAVADACTPKERNDEDARVPGNRVVEQYARSRRRVDASCRGSEDGVNAKPKELQNRADESERLTKETQLEVSSLKAQIEKLHRLILELELQNKKLRQDLTAAEAKIKTLEKPDEVESVSKSRFSNVMELVPRKSAEKTSEMEIKNRFPVLEPTTKTVEVQSKVVSTKPTLPLSTSHVRVIGSPPPPPPPPPPPTPAPQPPSKALGRATMNKPSALVELYHSLTKRDGKQGSMNNGGCARPPSNNVNGIVGELQHRSSHLLAIKADVETKGNFVKHLIEKVQTTSYTDMDDVLTFVDWLDGELSTLADERAVLKHFEWPEKKADALREAAFEYRDLKRLEAQVSSFKDDTSSPCESILRKISNLLDKLEQSAVRLIKLRNANMLLYRDYKIPTDWMLDSGMVSKMKQVSVMLARVYIGRVSAELELMWNSERVSKQEALLFQGVRFAYRAHQFAGGLDSELMLTIEDLKKKVESQRREH